MWTEAWPNTEEKNGQASAYTLDSASCSTIVVWRPSTCHIQQPAPSCRQTISRPSRQTNPHATHTAPHRSLRVCVQVHLAILWLTVPRTLVHVFTARLFHYYSGLRNQETIAHPPLFHKRSGWEGTDEMPVSRWAMSKRLLRKMNISICLLPPPPPPSRSPRPHLFSLPVHEPSPRPTCCRSHTLNSSLEAFVTLNSRSQVHTIFSALRNPLHSSLHGPTSPGTTLFLRVFVDRP